MACGVLGYTPAEFYAMTPSEFSLAVKGWEALHGRNMQVVGWAVANLLSPHVKKGARKGLMRSMINTLLNKAEGAKGKTYDTMTAGEKQQARKSVIERVKDRLNAASKR